MRLNRSKQCTECCTRMKHEACKAAPGVNRAGADCGRLKVPPSNDPSSTSAVVRPIDAEEQEPDHLIKEREEVKEQQRLLSQEKETLRQRTALNSAGACR